MHPYLLHSGRIFLPTFGVLAAIGLMAALGLAERSARLARVDPERLWDAGLVAIVAAFVLSRVLLIAQNWHTFLTFPLVFLAVPSLTAPGLALSAGATLLYLRYKSISLLPALDAWSPCATLLWSALALGHFFEGSDPGLPAHRFPGLRSAADPTLRHPIALYAAVIALLLTFWLYRRLRTRSAPGRTAACALLGVGLAQFLLSFLRDPALESLLGLDALQWVALAMFVSGGLLLAFTPQPTATHWPVALNDAHRPEETPDPLAPR